MLCAECNNLLTKVTDQGKLRYLCETCGTEFAASGRDTLIHQEDNKSYSLSKDGKIIWNYPANPKTYKDCGKCKAKIVAWERDRDMNIIYGCACGNSWKEYLAS